MIKKDDDVIGDDVNVASRIEPFSAVGGIAISQKVQQVYQVIKSSRPSMLASLSQRSF